MRFGSGAVAHANRAQRSVVTCYDDSETTQPASVLTVGAASIQYENDDDNDDDDTDDNHDDAEGRQARRQAWRDEQTESKHYNYTTKNGVGLQQISQYIAVCRSQRAAADAMPASPARLCGRVASSPPDVVSRNISRFSAQQTDNHALPIVCSCVLTS